MGIGQDAEGLQARPGEIAPLLRDLIALSAMRYGRAPLPISRSLLKICTRLDLAESVDDLETLVRRYLFLGDERLVLSELRMKAEASRALGPALLTPRRTIGTCSGAA